MITPTMGIGRNWLASVLARVLQGHVGAGIALPEILDGQFNGRLSRKLLCIVDELREGSGGQRYQRAQRLKTIITEKNRHINAKYGLQSVEKNCARWLMFSNHFDALPFDNGDRRVEVIANPTEVRSESYYTSLYALVDDSAFIASVRHLLLADVNLTTFNAGAHAKMNAAKVQAIGSMKTDVENKMEEFKADCTTALTSRKTIDALFRNSYGQPLANASHLSHAIEGAGYDQHRPRGQARQRPAQGGHCRQG